MLYLLHFEQPVSHAQHYLGFTDDLDGLLAAHRSPSGSHHRLMQVVHERGIGWTLVRTWPGDRAAERKLKHRKNGRRLCPRCNPQALRLATRTA